MGIQAFRIAAASALGGLGWWLFSALVAGPGLSAAEPLGQPQIFHALGIVLVLPLLVFILVRQAFKTVSTENARPDLSSLGALGDQILYNLRNGALVVDLDMRYRVWNPAMERISGVAAGQVLGRKPLELFPFLQERGIYPLMERALRGESVVSPEYPFHVPIADRRGWARAEYFPLRDEAGEVLGLFGMVQEITDRKSAEQAREASNRQLNALLNSIPDMAWLKDGAGRLLAVNEAYAAAAGAAPAELLGRNDLELWPDGQGNSSRDRDAEVLAGRERRRVANLLVDQFGRERWIESIRTPVFDEHGDPAGIAGIARDITETRRALSELRESEERFRALVENAEAVIFILDAEGVFLLSEGKALARLGLRPGEVVGKSAFELYQGHASIVDSIRRALAGHLARATNVLGEMAFETVYSPYRDPDGRVVGVAGVAIDVSEQRRAEREVRRLNTELEQRVRERTAQLEAVNKELETFTYSVSHDLKTPLRGIDGYSKLLLDDYSDRLDADGRAFLHNVRRGAQQMAELIEDLLDYSRLERRALRTTKLSLKALLRQLVDERAEETRARDAELAIALPFDAISADRDGLGQVLRNLLDNALKFSRDAHPPTVAIGGREDADAWVLWVRDNGIGFDLRFHNRIFEIFQRLQRSEDYPGTGIGLTIVRKAMQRMGGRVWAESAPGQGATFFLSFPKPR
jgi:PAS domain S-box-containing protein